MSRSQQAEGGAREFRLGCRKHLIWFVAYFAACMFLRVSAQVEFEQLWLPLRPLASDNLLHGIYRMSRHDALGKRFIEVNPRALSNLLVVDIDHADAALRALSVSKHPMAQRSR